MWCCDQNDACLSRVGVSHRPRSHFRFPPNSTTGLLPAIVLYHPQYVPQLSFPTEVDSITTGEKGTLGSSKSPCCPSLRMRTTTRRQPPHPQRAYVQGQSLRILYLCLALSDYTMYDNTGNASTAFRITSCRWSLTYIPIISFFLKKSKPVPRS